MRAFLFTAAAVLVATALGATTLGALGVTATQLVFGRPPAVVPPGHLSPTGACIVTVSQSSASLRGSVTVDSSPSAVTLLWLPGLNARPCVATITTATANRARSLAGAIGHAPIVVPGNYLCPNDDGAELRLYFAYSGDHLDEIAEVALSGCRWISAPGRGARSSGALFAALGVLAPSPWKRYFSSGGAEGVAGVTARS